MVFTREMSITHRRTLIEESIKDMKKLKYSVVVIGRYEEQLIEITETINQNKEHDNKQKLLFKQQESPKV